LTFEEIDQLFIADPKIMKITNAIARKIIDYKENLIYS
jgi:hypothetical protein